MMYGMNRTAAGVGVGVIVGVIVTLGVRLGVGLGVSSAVWGSAPAVSLPAAEAPRLVMKNSRAAQARISQTMMCAVGSRDACCILRENYKRILGS